MTDNPFTMPFDENESQSDVTCKNPIQTVFTELNPEMEKALDTALNKLLACNLIDETRVRNTQIPVVKQILLAYLNKKSFILEAPTGVGKTIISVLTINAISEYHKKSGGIGYVLTSSKALQDQLENDINRFNLDGWAILKGQANYICNKNGLPFPERKCQQYSMSKAFDELECASECEYLNRRFAAINSKSAVLSYQYWLTSMNFVYSLIGGFAPFQERLVTVMDECHSLSSILQDMFTINLTENYLLDLEKMQDFLLYFVPNNTMEIIDRANDIRKRICALKIYDKKLSLLETLSELSVLGLLLKDYAMICESSLSKWNKNHEKLSETGEPKHFAKLIERTYNRAETINYFISTTKGEEEWIVRKFSDIRGINKLTVQTLKEVSLFNRHVHKFTGFTLYMSATIGDIPTFAKNCGIENYEYLYMQSTWKFEKSPIIKVLPPISLGSKDKDTSMPILLKRMLYICEKLHPNECGIIHTTNFEISEAFKKYVFENAIQPSRFLFYDDSQQKSNQLEFLKHTLNGVIVGPSLIEGIDLKDNLSRFCIFAKVPYPALDEFNQKRMTLIPGWYDWKTYTSFLQGIGRSIRHANDYATTYLMDSCFNLMFKKSNPQPYILRRIKTLDISELMEPKQTVDELMNF